MQRVIANDSINVHIFTDDKNKHRLKTYRVSSIAIRTIGITNLYIVKTTYLFLLNNNFQKTQTNY